MSKCNKTAAPEISVALYEFLPHNSCKHTNSIYGIIFDMWRKEFDAGEILRFKRKMFAFSAACDMYNIVEI